MSASPPAMDFEAFIDWSARARATNPRYDFAETRIGKALEAYKPELCFDAATPRVYRCDLVKSWSALKGISTENRTALACEGVRHALRTIFEVLAQEGQGIAVPSDVYPVYSRLAAEAGLPTITFDTFPNLDIERIFGRVQSAGMHHVLLPMPLKLHGRSWTEREVNSALQWLAADGSRRILLDAVYEFGAAISANARRLLATDQVVYLDSLSKGFLHAAIFGVAVVPVQDIERFTPAFRALSPDLQKLQFADQLLKSHRDVAAQVTQSLEGKRTALQKILKSLLPDDPLPVERGYLIAIPISAQELLERYSLLALPASIFGAPLKNWSLASCLRV